MIAILNLYLINPTEVYTESTRCNKKYHGNHDKLLDRLIGG